MCTLRLQFVITHMLHLKGVFKFIFRSRPPYTRKRNLEGGGQEHPNPDVHPLWCFRD